MLLVLLIGVLTTICIYYLVIKSCKYWANRNIPCAKSWPIVGSLGAVFFGRKSYPDVINELYRQCPNFRYNGMFQFFRPCLLLRDVDLIKQITVKEFDHFTDHLSLVSADADSPFAKNLFSLNGLEWKEMRSTLSPAFTSSKMRAMYDLIAECAANLTEHYMRIVDADNNDVRVVPLEMKETASRLANDLIATTAFGIKCDSFKDPSNEFYTMGKRLTTFNFWQTMKTFFIQLFPAVSSALRIRFFDTKSLTFFRKIILQTIAQREAKGIVRPDLIHLLMEAKKGRLRHEEANNKPEHDTGFATVEESSIHEGTFHKQLTDDDIVAQGVVFFFAGFDTVSTASSFMAHELAVNPDVQAKLQHEIDRVFAENNSKVPYESLLKMKYLDQVVSESLRMWPPVFQIDRLCVNDFVIEAVSDDERPLLVEKGMDCVIPVIGLHHDEKYFMRPQRFDPDRFSDENKSNIVSGTYYPFGAGPRNCIGSRFALLEMKSMFLYLLAKFDIVPVDKTEIPMKMSPGKLNLGPKNGFWLGLKARKITTV